MLSIGNRCTVSSQRHIAHKMKCPNKNNGVSIEGFLKKAWGDLQAIAGKNETIPTIGIQSLMVALKLSQGSRNLDWINNNRNFYSAKCTMEDVYGLTSRSIAKDNPMNKNAISVETQMYKTKEEAMEKIPNDVDFVLKSNDLIYCWTTRDEGCLITNLFVFKS